MKSKFVITEASRLLMARRPRRRTHSMIRPAREVAAQGVVVVEVIDLRVRAPQRRELCVQHALLVYFKPLDAARNGQPPRARVHAGAHEYDLRAQCRAARLQRSKHPASQHCQQLRRLSP